MGVAFAIRLRRVLESVDSDFVLVLYDDFILENRIDTVVLGCTHYPLIRSNIERRYPDIRIIDPSEEIVSSIENTLKKKEMMAEYPETENIFYASDLSENFVRMIRRIFMHSDVNVEFKNLDLEEV